MTLPRVPKHTRINDYPAISMQRLRDGVGGKRVFNGLAWVEVEVPNGVRVQVNIRRRPSPLGKGEIPNLECPSCRGGCEKLRVVPDPPYLMCWRCVQKIYRVLFVSDEKAPIYNVMLDERENTDHAENKSREGQDRAASTGRSM